MEIVFVCTGNICRSPMAEVLFRHHASDRGVEVSVSSYGTWGQDGSPATSNAVEVMRGRGLDLGRHVARTVDAEVLRRADLVVVMTSVHARELEQLNIGKDHVRLLKELVELEVEDLPDGPPRERLAALLAATRPPYRRELDLDDPYGMPLGVYDRTAQILDEHLRHLAGLLFTDGTD